MHHKALGGSQGHDHGARISIEPHDTRSSQDIIVPDDESNRESGRTFELYEMYAIIYTGALRAKLCEPARKPAQFALYRIEY